MYYQRMKKKGRESTLEASESIHIQKYIRDLVSKIDNDAEIDTSEEAYKKMIKEQWSEFIIWVQRLPVPEPAPHEPEDRLWTNKETMENYRKKLLEVQFINNDTWNQMLVTMRYLVPNLKKLFDIGELDDSLQEIIKQKMKEYGKFSRDQQSKLNSIKYRKKELTGTVKNVKK